MRKFHWSHTLAILLLLISFLQAQETSDQKCQIVKEYPDGSVLIKINDKEMLAITQDMERRMLKLKRDVLDAEKEILLKDSLLANYDNTIGQYEKTITQMKDYIQELEYVLKGYKSLARDYKKMHAPWLSLRFGVGATSRDHKPAIMMGLDVRRILISGFVQERNSGVLVGTSFRLF
ncbi:MAG: hypothetical protein GXO74_07750 [Calditrichaeota bacterium]|nr:hypothetical protein [Calditrichota bacterium]